MALRSALAGALCLALSGCSVVDGLFTASPEAPESSAPEPVVIKAPLDSNRFRLVEGEDIVGRLQVTVARDEDTFVEFARTYGLGFDELRHANPDVDPWLPGEGTPVVLPTRFVLPDAPREGIVLNVAVKRLFYFPPVAEGEAPEVETYPIGIGREDWATPTGETSVVARARDPVWFVPTSIRKEHEEMGDPLPAQVPPGPDNPLGTRVLQLGLPGYLIHGTNKPAGVGMRVSHGCVRLYPEDIESLFERVPVGTPVRIVNQPLLIGARGNEVFLESHPPLAEDSRDPRDDLDERLEARARTLPNGRAVVNVARLEAITAEQRGFPVSILAGGADTEATLRGARQVENIITHESVEQQVAAAADAATEPDSP